MADRIKYIRTVSPTTDEIKRGAEVVFIYMYLRKKTRVLACECHGSFEQWGAPVEVLGANVDLVEKWVKKSKNN